MEVIKMSESKKILSSEIKKLIEDLNEKLKIAYERNLEIEMVCGKSTQPYLVIDAIYEKISY